MVDVMHLFVFALMFLITLGFINQTNPSAQEETQKKFNEMTCPMPAITGLWNASGTIQYSGATYNYPSVSNQTLTLTCTPIHTLDGFDYFYGTPLNAIGGTLIFIADYISEAFYKIQSFFSLLASILSPASFDLFGYTIDDIGLMGQIFVTSLYIVCYIFIGVGIYKIVNPFGGA